MARLKLSKHELANQRNQLKLYQKMLPSLDLKRRQLALELAKSERELAATRAAVDALETRIGAELPMLAIREIEIGQLVRMTDFALGEENVVGVRVPVLERIDCTISDFSAVTTPAWVDVLVLRLRDAAEQRIRVQVGAERVRRLERAVRRTTQRVNLFERVLIPRAKDAIRRIMIYLGDQERSAVANSKLTKAKIKRQQEALLGVGT